MLPLPLFPTTPEVLDAMDARLSLQHINTFMKNALIRGVNNLYDLAPLPNKDLKHFLRYAVIVSDNILTHFKGDQLFMNAKNSEGRSLVDIEEATDRGFSRLNDSISVLQNHLQSWADAPGSYSPIVLRSSLGSIATLMLPWMENQRNILSPDNMMKFCTDAQELHRMIHENLVWLTSQIDISVLLPFVLSHHDIVTSTYWPSVSPEGLQLVPEFVEKDTRCWELAPFDPITRRQSPKRVLLSVL